MPIIRIAALLLVFTTFLTSAASSQDEAKKVFSQFKDKIVQVLVLDKTSGLKAVIGSGFVISPSGHIASNYHVVSKFVQKPKQYNIEYLKENGEKGELSLVDIDVIHDLSILKSEKLKGNYLEIEPNELSKGEMLYSLGNPYDLGLTIVQGTYNGLLEKSLYHKIHFTGSINPGMSGGPTINEKGKVVGVNVSTAGNQVSFLVPSKYIIALLSEISDKLPGRDLNNRVREQLFENQVNYISLLLNKPITAMQIGNYSLPGEMAPFIKCWGDTSKKDELLYEQMYQHCSTNDDLFISDSFSTGSIQYRHDLYATEKLGTIRFYRFLEEQLQQPAIFTQGDGEEVSNYACKTSLVEHNGLTSKVVFCLRGYKKMDGLYDSYLSALTIVSDKEALRTTLNLSGISHESAARLSKAFIEAVSWKK